MRLSEALNRMRVRVSVAGGSITGELYDDDRVDLSFAPGFYGLVAASVLEGHLVSLAREMHAEYVRQYFRALSVAYERTITKEPAVIGRQDREYTERRQSLVAEGRSARGQITITVRGMQSWQVRIGRDALRTLDERQFSLAFGEAAQALIRDQFAGIRALKEQVYG
ncbi:hypothetical protein [Actinoplanes sp. HUAS TT8]|uniref:hypothetical protein n=1 Tax=Actinoplanes sp. HUAS TT8 TaxID=3447453 RepID=UPI003F5261A7